MITPTTRADQNQVSRWNTSCSTILANIEVNKKVKRRSLSLTADCVPLPHLDERGAAWAVFEDETGTPAATVREDINYESAANQTETLMSFAPLCTCASHYCHCTRVHALCRGS
ncbi:hypothetical protein BaRGS_00031095 [Batillaria attramentaria]|uniref:Uncharacterized protein n=1 Tax=Batillaria attramentaria TaxID=370345 RepID=A0ABD0JRI1_9CAEN